MTVQTLTLKPATAEIMRSPATVKVVFSGRRFGKTRMGMTWLLTRARQTKDVCGSAATGGQLMRSAASDNEG